MAFLPSAFLILAVQAPQATIAGVVRDQETGAPLPGAVVTLPDLQRSAVAGAGGRYLLTEVPAGPQHVAVRFLGYAPRTLHALVPAEGSLELTISLRPEPLRLGTIEVRHPPPVPGLEDESIAAFADREVTLAAVRNHPLLAEPDALRGLGGGEVTMEPESPSGLHVRGGESDQVAYLLDGIPVFSPYHAAGSFSGWNPDALSSLRLSSASPSPAEPDALAGVVGAETREPGAQHGAQATLSTTQARLTLDGPVSVAGAGYLVAVRSAFPGYPSPKNDPTYLGSESGDLLLKLELPALGGRLRLLGYENDNEIDAASAPDGPGVQPPRNSFEWGGRSLGATWRRDGPGPGLSLAAWRAEAEAAAHWSAPESRLALGANRRDHGLRIAIATGSTRARTVTGIRVEHSTTRYAVAGEGDSTGLALAGRALSASPFAQHERALGARTRVELGAALATGDGGVDLLPRARLSWKPAERLTLSAGYAGLRQSAQSLRNPESVVGSVFPADLYLGSGAPGIPVARARQLVAAADYRPALGVRLSLQAYGRHANGLVLTAPRAGEPFASGDVTVGTGSAYGVSATAAANGARFGFLASYGLQRVRLTHGDSSYVPAHGTTHLAEAGVIVYPTATLSLRLGAAGAAGRRTTPPSGGLEWEACNLLDRGCELGGSPHYGGAALGATGLPSYLRIDLGVRQHWHLRVAGRDASVALFGTVSNLLGRRNLLTYVADPETGKLTPVEMRPRAPLVVGLDWRY